MSRQSRSPGTMLLEIASWLFNDQFLEKVVQPTIADLQCEIVDAGDDRLKRLRVRWRGYCAFWIVAVAAPFASWAAPTPTPAIPFAAAHVVTGTILLALFGLAGGMWLIVALAGGGLLALALHAWYDRHPSDVPHPIERQPRFPQINFSSMDVAGNIGGLIFVVGSLAIVSLALPSVFWFLFAATLAASGVAWCLAAWHLGHPRQSAPLVLR